MIKHFIDIGNFSLRELDLILSTAKKIKKNSTRYEKLFKNKSLGLLFQKESSRTRLSFSIGMQKFGGNVIELDLKAIGFGTRESEEDILKTLSCYIDCLMIRNNNHKKVAQDEEKKSSSDYIFSKEAEKKIKELQKANTNMSSELDALKAQMEEIKTMLLEKQND